MHLAQVCSSVQGCSSRDKRFGVQCSSGGKVSAVLGAKGLLFRGKGSLVQGASAGLHLGIYSRGKLS